MALPTKPTLTPVPTPLPQRGQAESVFTPAMNSFIAWTPNHQQNLVDTMGWIDASYGETEEVYDATVVAKNAAEQSVVDAGEQVTLASEQVTLASEQVTLASEQVTLASEQADRSELAADSAAAFSNFRGVWSEQTGSATAGGTYEHNGGLWVLLADVADITLSEPSDSNADWLGLAPGIDDADVSIVKTWSSNQLAQKSVIGTPDWPVSLTYDASDNLTEALYVKDTDQFKQTLNYNGAGDLDTVVYEQSSDSGGTWVTLGTETLVYSNGALVSTNWSEG